MKRPSAHSSIPALGLLSLIALAGCGRLHAPAAVNPTIIFSVTVPPGTPATDSIWISGNQDSLGSWNGAGVKLDKQPDGTFSTQLSFSPGTALEFKVTRGSWDTVEKGPGGAEIANRTYTVGASNQLLDLTVANWGDQTTSGVVHTLTGNIKYLKDVKSAYLAKTRDIIIYLPPDYDTNPSRRYPVLYMHDGQNLMDAATAFVGVEWGVDEAAQRLINAGQMEPIIIVGVYNTSDRIPEYTPVPDPQYGGGNADNYGKFLKLELKPLIDGTYRTKPDAQSTGIAGSSLGGLVSMYFGLTLSDTFTRIGVVSPSVWWDNKDIVTRVNNLSGKLPLRIWEDIGTAESADTSADNPVANAEALRDALAGKGWVLGSDLKYLEVQGARHSELYWSARVDQILMYLYPPTTP